MTKEEETEIIEKLNVINTESVIAGNDMKGKSIAINKNFKSMQKRSEDLDSELHMLLLRI